MMIRRLVATKAPRPHVAVFTGFATQTKPARLESAGASPLDTFNFSVNPRNMIKMVKGPKSIFESNVY